MRRIFRGVDRLGNAINERTGGNLQPGELYLFIIGLLNDYDPDFGDIDIEAIYSDLEQLIFRHPPRLLFDEAPEVLRRLRALPGVTTNLLSNTGFIRGRTLRPILDRLGLGRHFDFQLYSDELRHSKPDPRVFAAVQQQVNTLHPDWNETSDVITHVGDNPRADVAGAQAVGWRAILVSKSFGLQDLLEG